MLRVLFLLRVVVFAGACRCEGVCYGSKEDGSCSKPHGWRVPKNWIEEDDRYSERGELLKGKNKGSVEGTSSSLRGASDKPGWCMGRRERHTIMFDMSILQQ